jgi:hypothetical protein
MKRLPLLLVLVWALSSAWYLFLAQQILQFPDTTIADGWDTIFNGDVSVRYPRITIDPAESPEIENDIRHPAAKYLWSALGRPLRQALEWRYPAKNAQLLAAMMVLALLGGLGTAALIFAAVRLGTPWPVCCLVLPAYWGFTAQVCAVVPEYFGIVGFLLSLAFAMYCSRMGTRGKCLGLAVVGILAFLTTTTMVLFPLLCLAHVLFDRAGVDPWRWSWQHKKRLSLVGLLVIVLAGLVFARFRLGGGWKAFGLSSSGPIVGWFQRGRVWPPDQAVSYVTLSFIYPAVGPDPQVVSVHPISKAFDRDPVLTYDPWSIADYGLWNGLGAVVWAILLGWCVVIAIRDRACRTAALILLEWIAFNIAFHLVWGDEYFLYSVHWAWALFMLVLIGVRGIRWPLLAAAVLLICIGQGSTMVLIRGALDQIFPSMQAGP